MNDIPKDCEADTCIAPKCTEIDYPQDCAMHCKATEKVDHPLHYGGKDNPYEAIKVIEHWDLGFALGNVVKYILRAEKKQSHLDDLKKARWYLDYEIQKIEKQIENERLTS